MALVRQRVGIFPVTLRLEGNEGRDTHLEFIDADQAAVEVRGVCQQDGDGPWIDGHTCAADRINNT